MRGRLLVLGLLWLLDAPGRAASAAPAGKAHPELLKPSRLAAGKDAPAANRPRRIALVIGTFDPFHEDHFALARQGRAEGADEVLLVPGWNPRHKPDVTPIGHRMKMIAARIRKERGLNLYRADASRYLRLGQDAFVEHVKALYGTDDVTIHIGQDAFEDGWKKYGISPAITYRYRVVPRGDGPLPTIPEALKDKISFAPSGVPGGYSSSQVRERIKAGQALDGMLHPTVERHVRMHHLYE